MLFSPLIAIAENELDILTMLDVLVVMEGYRTVRTTTAAAVPALIAQHRPALLLLDIRMEQPDSGWRVLDELRADPATAQLPVIVCSAELGLAAQVQRRADPHLMSVSRPFDPPRLLAAIQQMLDPVLARGATA